MNSNPSGRSQAIPYYQCLPPNKCSMCGRIGGNNELFIDPQISYDYEGSIYFCRDCVLDMASHLGIYTSSEYQQIENRYAALHSAYLAAATENTRLKNAVDGLAQQWVDNRPSNSPISAVPVDNENNIPAISDNGQGDSTSEGTEPEIIESVSDQGPDGITSSDSSDTPTRDIDKILSELGI